MSRPRLTFIPEVPDVPAVLADRPYCLLWSLLDMKRFYAERLTRIHSTWGQMQTLAQTVPALRGVGLNGLPALNSVRAELEAVELRFSLKLIDQIIGEIRDDGRVLTPTEYAAFLFELQRRIDDELEMTVFMRVTADTAKYFDARPLFGQQVETQFPSVVLDIEEAGRCLALGRHTACVFHLMRILGPALEAVALALNVNISVPAWQGILDRITKELEKRNNQKPAGWITEEPFYSTAAAFLLAVKVAWRNPVMHDIKHIYDADSATDVFETAKTFVRHIATKLGEPPP